MIMMKPINILVIDDNKKEVERLYKIIKKADKNNVISNFIIDDAITKIGNVEDYNPNNFGVDFDVLLVDYQLNCNFSGALAAAWIMLQKPMPKFTLTTGVYPGPQEGFDGFILKDDLLNNPEQFITQIVEAVESFNSKHWLEKQHDLLVGEYQNLIDDKLQGRTNGADEDKILILEKILDKFEKILDAEQDKIIKEKYAVLDEEMNFRGKIDEQNVKMNELDKRLKEYLKKIEQG